MNQAILIPQKSVGNIQLDDNIENYPDRALEFSNEDGDEVYSCFAFRDTPVQAFVNESGTIESIRCDTECLWQGVNLIGLPYAEFVALHGEEPDEVEQLEVEGEQGNQTQDVYDFDDLGLQLWVFEGKIVVVMVACLWE